MSRVPAVSYVETGRTPHWMAAVWSGLIGGLVFLVLEMIMVPLFLGVSPWAPVRMIGAILLGSEVLPPPATFDLGIFLAAAVVHFVLAIAYGLILASLVFRFTLGTSLGIGLLFGAALYLINFFVFTGAFPWFAEARNWVSLFAHLVFGLTAAWVYKGLAHREMVREEEEVPRVS